MVVIVVVILMMGVGRSDDPPSPRPIDNPKPPTDQPTPHPQPTPPLTNQWHTQGKGSVKGIAEYLKLADDAKKGLADLSPQHKADVLQVRTTWVYRAVPVGWAVVIESIGRTYYVALPPGRCRNV